MLRKIKHPLLLLLVPAVLACSSENEEAKGIASTHPALEEELAEDPVTSPVHNSENEEIYQRYRITMEDYVTDDRYTTESMYDGSLADLDENSHPDAGTFRTSLQEGLRNGVNFAGKYTVVTVGCGSTCQQHFIIDRTTGKIIEKIQSSIGAKYSSDSRIFIVNPPDSTINYSECNYCTPEAYVLEENELRKLSYEHEIQQ